MTNAHRFWDTKPTSSFTLLRIQLMIAPMMPDNASATLTPNLPCSGARVFSLLLSHSFVSPPWESNTSIRTLIAIPMVVKMEVIVMHFSLNSVHTFWPMRCLCSVPW